MAFRVVGILFVAALIGLVSWAVLSAVSDSQEQNTRQSELDPFYTPPDSIPDDPGAVVRTEPMDVDVKGGSAERILYVSERADGEPAVSSGMIFIPEKKAPKGGRPVVAWSHGTLGMGEACVPSRSENPTEAMSTWIGPMMQQGWVVVATDYVGLGTPGPNQYAIAQAEVRDVVNSVRAARNIPAAKASERYVTYGHSQGGHSSIWTGHLGPEYAPELDLLAVSAAAPALNLLPIADAQWDTAVGWVIGSDLIESWPTYYPDLPVDSVLTPLGGDLTQRLTAECVETAGLEALVLEKAGQQFFSENPTKVGPWSDALKAQTPQPLPRKMPVFIAQGTADEIVLPWPNAIVQQQWCKADSDLTMLWLGGVKHVPAAKVAGPSVVEWIAGRFDNSPTEPNCSFPAPISTQPGPNPSLL